jgi:hypothetical protein
MHVLCAILVLNGEQASAKSTLVKVLRLLIDPHTCVALNPPSSTLNLMATAVNGWLEARAGTDCGGGRRSCENRIKRESSPDFPNVPI